MATRVEAGIHAAIVCVYTHTHTHTHTLYLLSNIIPRGLEALWGGKKRWKKENWCSGYGQQWWHLIWVMVTRQPQAEWTGVGLLIVS